MRHVGKTFPVVAHSVSLRGCTKRCEGVCGRANAAEKAAHFFHIRGGRVAEFWYAATDQCVAGKLLDRGPDRRSRPA
jgi:hypothetical protein